MDDKFHEGHHSFRNAVVSNLKGVDGLSGEDRSSSHLPDSDQVHVGGRMQPPMRDTRDEGKDAAESLLHGPSANHGFSNGQSTGTPEPVLDNNLVKGPPPGLLDDVESVLWSYQDPSGNLQGLLDFHSSLSACVLKRVFRSIRRATDARLARQGLFYAWSPDA